MAHLLGHPGCMESLRADLKDLQAAISDVFSRVGAVRFPSWKFPDKVSCELDLAVLLERYSYSQTEPEFSQHSHVVLLELVIDRLLLLLQSFTSYTGNLLSQRAVPTAQDLGPCMSAGLTARRYWSSMLKLGASYQQLLAQKKDGIPVLPAPPQVGKAEEKLPGCSLPDVLRLKPSVAISQPASPCPSPGGCGDASGGTVSRASQSSSGVPREAAGCPQAPCDTCSTTRATLLQVGKAISSLCQSQNIPSALGRIQETLEESPGRNLSPGDLSSWAAEQSQDLSRLGEHLRGLLQELSPLKSELEEAEKEREELRKQVEDFSRLLRVEKESQAQQKKEAEKTLEAKQKEYSEAVARLEQDKQDLRRGAALLEERLCTLKEELTAKQAALQDLEVTKTTLLEEMRTTMVARSQVLELEEKVQLLSSQRESLDEELRAITTQLEKEKAKGESMLRHQESLQAKQRTLLQELDSLDQEREELQKRLGEAEEDKARLEEQLEQERERSGQRLRVQEELLETLRGEKLSLEQSVTELQTKVSKLEEQEQELKERERLLVFFPELHIPAETQFESTGSLTEDMEKQLQANSIRMDVLEQENMRLRAALAKVKVAAEQGVLKLIPQPQLWSQPSSQCSEEAEGVGWPSSRGSSVGTQGHAGDKEQHWKPLSADPPGKGRSCLSLPAKCLVLSPPKPSGRGRVRPPHPK
ncbi:coiled-coil domain-containing protein 157 isoform X2 [Heliangelus exortis]|uniref:coiled-coil domain-containing protein 157 isoform X2 n=1 Tax=Heliangelus exortis TaxID=472823 RepID=UPI003A903FF9